MACKIFLDLPGGLKMPALGYGTWQSSGDSLEIGLEAALEAGYRHIDTAAVYQNEDIIGRVLRRWFEAGKLKREDLFITTKLAPYALYPDKVTESLKESLQKLQVDYVDLYLLHFPIPMIPKENGDIVGDPNTDHIGLWKEMEAQVDAGRTRTIGVSNFNFRQIYKILKQCRIKPVNNQIEMHILMQQINLRTFCKEHGITIVAYAPLGSPGYNDFLKERGLPPKEMPDLLTNPVVQKIGRKYSKTPAQVLLRFLLQLGVATVPKSVTPSRIQENIDIFDFALDLEEMNELRDLEIGPSARISDFRVFKGIETKEIPDILNNPVVQKIAKKHSKTSTQVSLRYILQLGISAIPKSVTPARIKENIDIFDFKLDDEDMKELLGLEIGPSVRVHDCVIFEGRHLKAVTFFAYPWHCFRFLEHPEFSF